MRINEKKYLCFGPLRIRYETDRTAEIRKVTIGPLRLSYRYDEECGSTYLLLMRWEIPIRTAEGSSRRIRHYRMRAELSDARCQELLTEELSDLLGYKPDLDNPRTFNEKINWLKLHHHDPLITVCADKYAVKGYAEEVIGPEYVLPVLGVWNSADEIDFDALPDRFALKVNWSSGFNIIVPDKSELDTDAVRRQIETWMKPERNSYYDTFNWGYKNMKSVVYAEPYIEQTDGQVYDYKFYYSNGEFIYMFIATDRHKDTSLTYTFFDKQFGPLPFTYGGKPNAEPIPDMPKNLKKMMEFGAMLAEPFPFVRVDFYELSENEFYLGEMTFYSGGGTLVFDPPEWDRKMGDKIILDIDKGART